MGRKTCVTVQYQMLSFKDIIKENILRSSYVFIKAISISGEKKQHKKLICFFRLECFFP